MEDCCPSCFRLQTTWCSTRRRHGCSTCMAWPRASPQSRRRNGHSCCRHLGARMSLMCSTRCRHAHKPDVTKQVRGRARCVTDECVRWWYEAATIRGTSPDSHSTGHAGRLRGLRHKAGTAMHTCGAAIRAPARLCFFGTAFVAVVLAGGAGRGRGLCYEPDAATDIYAAARALACLRLAALPA